MQTLVDITLNYDVTTKDLEEYICNFMVDEFNVICDEGDDVSYKEVAETITKVYEQSKRGQTEELEKLRTLDAQMKEYKKKRLENQLEAQRKFEEHMSKIQPTQEVEEEDDDMDEEEKQQLEDDGFTVIDTKKKKKRTK